MEKPGIGRKAGNGGSKMKFCKQCGASLEDDMMFCNMCGAPQGEAPAEAAPVEEAPVEAAPVEEAPVEAAPVEEAPAEAAPVEEAPVVAAAPVEAAPVEAGPVEEAPVVAETPVEAAPVEEAAPVVAAASMIPAAAEYLPQAAPEAPAAPKKSKKGLIIGLVSAVVVVAALVAGILWFINNSKKETIDASQLVKVIGYGPQGYGKVAVLLAVEDNMYDIINADDDVNEYPGLWSYLYDSIAGDDNYPAGVRSLCEEFESDYFKKGSVKAKTWKTLKDEKISAAQKALKKLEVKIEDAGKGDGHYKEGDTIKITVEGKEDALKDAHIVLKNTTFEYTFTEKDFAPCKSLNPFDGFTVTCEGFEGAPKIEYNFYASIKKEILDMYLYDYKVDEDSLKNAKNNGDKIIFKAVPYGDTSKGYFTRNGVYYDYDEKACTYEFTLSGLEAPKDLDLFEGIKFKYSGKAPNLYISVDNSEMNELCRTICTYTVDKSSGLNIGDEITVTVKVYNKDKFAESGYTIDETKTYTYKIPDTAPHTVSATEANLTYDTALFDRMKTAFDAAVGTNYYPGSVQAPGTIKSVDEFKYTDAEIFSSKDENGNLRNQIMQLIEVAFTYTAADGTEQKKTVYCVCQAFDVYVSEDAALETNGSITVTYMDAKEDAAAAFKTMETTEGVDSKKLR